MVDIDNKETEVFKKEENDNLSNEKENAENKPYIKGKGFNVDF